MRQRGGTRSCALFVPAYTAAVARAERASERMRSTEANGVVFGAANLSRADMSDSEATGAVFSRATMTGFVVSDFADRLPQAIAEMAGWVNDGRLRSVEDTVPGDIEMLPNMLARLFTGQNTGKLALRIRTGRARGTPNAARAGRP